MPWWSCFLPYSPECVEGEVPEVLRRMRDEGLDGLRILHECFQIPHDPLRPHPVRQVAGLGVHPQGGIGDRHSAPFLFFAREEGVLLPHKINVGAHISPSRAVSSTVSTT